MGDKTVTTTNVDDVLNKDKVLQTVLQWLINQKPVTKNYELSTVQISEYTQALEYRLIMTEKNVNGTENFVPSSELRAVIVHDKTTHENVLISFEIIDKTVSSTQQTQTGQQPVPETPIVSVLEKPVTDYVVVDLQPAP